MLLYESLSGMRSCAHLYTARMESRGKERMGIQMTKKQPKDQGPKGVTRV